MTLNANGGKQKTNLVAIVVMFFLFAMISFVTNLAAPLGTIWKNSYSWAGMMGNMMNFLAYLFMGIPAGNLLVRIGYKKTALWAMAIGFIGLGVQYLSSLFGGDIDLFSVSGQAVKLNFMIYLLGAFISGFCVCMLNTVVNPMLTVLGGGGKKGNQLLQTGGALNSLSGTLTPMFVGMLIGSVTKHTSMKEITPLLFIAMGVFALSFLIILAVRIPEPHLRKKGAVKESYTHSPWSFRHTLLGVIGIFFYVGIEVGIPGELIFYVSDSTSKGAGILVNGAAIGGSLAAIYWFLMLIGRFTSGAISGKVSARTQLIAVSSVATILVVTAIFIPKDKGIDLPGFIYDPVEKTTNVLQEAGMSKNEIDQFILTKDVKIVSPYASELMNQAELKPTQMIESLETPKIPISLILLICCGLCTSVMWGGIFNLAVEGLGKYTAQASGIFMMMVVGGGVMPFIQNLLADSLGYMTSYWLVAAMLVYLFYYAVIGSKNVNTDIPVNQEEGTNGLGR